ncbi:MAG: hypothetical protein U5K77_00505 [Candidatus Saccharibacteria bacterium]|nr:hypothetical protein [Candidatus Saccharibacteria bacterium]
MPSEPENIPEMSPIKRAEIDRSEFGPKTYRWITRMNRGLMLQHVRVMLDDFQPTLEANGGYAYYHTYYGDEEYKVLLSNTIEVAHPGSHTVIINKQRSTKYGEAGFPDGTAIELCDGAITPRGKWLNSAIETVLRPDPLVSWDRPNLATILQKTQDGLHIYGNLADGGFSPQPPRDLDDIAMDSEMLWKSYEALALCAQSHPEDDIYNLKLHG